MTSQPEIAIIGAGPYGLSLAAHLSAAGVAHRIFGQPLLTWREHMPQGMLLKSDGFASSLCAPDPGCTLKAYSAARGLAYGDTGVPVSLERFIEYGLWFQKRYVPHLETCHVRRVERGQGGFVLTLETGEVMRAGQVVVATGVAGLEYIPDTLAHLPPELVSHSAQHREGSRLAGKKVIVLGAGASAVDVAAMLSDAGAETTILARAPSIRFHTSPRPPKWPLLQNILRPPSGIGPGWRSWMCANLPQLFRYLPAKFRVEIVRRHLGPASSWYMRKRIEGHVAVLLGRTLLSAAEEGGKIKLQITAADGSTSTLVADHVVAATGYHPDIKRWTFLAPELAAEVETNSDAPELSSVFESSARGLYFMGPPAAIAFGPLMRFAVGCEFAAPRVARHLIRRSQ